MLDGRQGDGRGIMPRIFLLSILTVAFVIAFAPPPMAQQSTGLGPATIGVPPTSRPRAERLRTKRTARTQRQKTVTEPQAVSDDKNGSVGGDPDAAPLQGTRRR